MEKQETNTKSEGSRNPKGPHLKKRTLTPEQLEKMRVGRMEKAKERREKREKDKLIQQQAINQQKERIELLKITKKKKAEIKKRLAEVKRGETKLEDVEEIIEQYDKHASASQHSAKAEGPHDEEPLESIKEVSEEVFEEPKENVKLNTHEEVVEKVKLLKEKETEKIKEFEKETLKFEDYYKEAVEKIINTLPKNAREHFKRETDKFDPRLDVKQNIENMIENINKKIVSNVSVVEKVKDSLEKIEDEVANKPDTVETITSTSDKHTIKTKKKVLKEKLQTLYNLR